MTELSDYKRIVEEPYNRKQEEMRRALQARAEAAEAERDSLRAALEEIATQATEYRSGDGWHPLIRSTAAVFNAIARKALSSARVALGG